MKSGRNVGAMAIVCILLAPAQAQEPPLMRETLLSGVTTTCGSPDKDYILEVNGGGVALGDFDGDGACDLVVVDGSTLERVAAGEPGFPPRLLLGDGAGGFAPAAGDWEMAGGRWGMGCATGDLDGDGWLDLVVTEWGRDRVFLNRGGTGFTELEETGLKGTRWGTSAVLFDYDGDLVLDLAVVNYLAFDPEEVSPPGGGCSWKGHPVMCGPEGLIPVHDQLCRGNGDGTFTDVTRSAGFVPSEAGFGLGALALDYDVDGDLDLFVTNDSTPNHLWENRGDGTFEEVGFFQQVSHDSNGREQACMGIASGDVDGDGRADLFVTNFSGESNTLYQSAGKAGFRDRTARAGLVGPSLGSLGWGTGLADFDLDGDLDAFSLNGHVYPQADLAGTDTSYAQHDQLFRSDGSGRFVAEPLSDAPARVSRAASVADLDGDGDLDIVGLELGGAVRVLINRTLEPAAESDDETGEAVSGPHWLRVRPLAAGRLGRIGARVTVEIGDERYVREVHTSGGFQAAQPAEAHFGLGEHGRVERVHVRWPSGRETTVEDVTAGQVLALEEPE